MPRPDQPDCRFLLLPLPEHALLAFGGFVDKMRFSADEEDLSQQRYCQWTVTGLNPGTVRASSGVEIAIDAPVTALELADYDYLVIFGCRQPSMAQALAAEYRPLLQRASRCGVSLVAVDNASFLLAEAGLLAGHSVALHWRHQQEFRAAFPDIPIHADALYHLDGNRISCAGGSATIDLATALLERHCGPTRALKGLADMLVDESRAASHALRSLVDSGGRSRPTQRAVALMRQHLAGFSGGGSSDIERIAAQVGLSRRQLDRAFTEEHGMTCHQYWLELRLRHVHWRLHNSSQRLSQIADEVGFTDVSHLCRAVKRRYGATPQTLRQTKP
ncbi:helix-turn-helix domain-containing protein [Ferrimonas balearica]|uniref:GlxA family transcriptional regulator n=1 Tax=Ferrimonas balearica TaxID=44012 RepID=UPI001C987DC7|nr:helix-turn-helix domain-containing protein [Ferrimonas balearica]MBY6108028.1 helix-turn-helix domain-containing protein [Ferrimonas balearica]